MKDKKINNSNINEMKNKLKNKTLNINELTKEEIELLKIELKKEIEIKTKELEELNKKIRAIKFKIDNWNNN